MGVKERKERQRLELRQGILDAARQVALEQGWQSVTMRKIADKIEYSPPVIYEHFDSKEAILVELLREGYRELFSDLTLCTQDKEDPKLQCLRMVTAYWEFAWRNPELYQVMHGLDGVPFGTAQAPIEARTVFDVVRGVLQTYLESVGSGSEDTDIDGQVDIWWSLMHGLTTLTMSGRLYGGKQRAEALLILAVEKFLESYRR